MSLLLYVVAGAGALAAARRVSPLSWRAAAALLLLPLCFAGRALLTGGIWAPIDLAYMDEPLASVAQQVGVEHSANPALSDVAAQFIPWNVALRRSIARGQWPLWNPYEFCGDPLAAAAQSAPYHPVTLLGLLVPLADGLTFTAAITLFLAALAMFLFLCDLGCDELPSLFGAAAWAFTTHLFAFILTAHALTICIAPLVFLAARRVAREPSRRSASLLVVALTLLTLAGHPETELHVVAMASAFAMFEMAAARPQARRAVAYAFGAGVVTLLLCAIHLGPMLEVLPQTREFLHRQSGIANATSVAQTLHLLRANLFPILEGTATEMAAHTTPHGWVGTSFAGAIVFAPAIAALLAWRRRREIAFFAALLVFGLLIGAKAPILTDLLAHLPLFSIAINERLIEFAAFALCVLAALGLQGRERLLAGTLIALALVAIGSMTTDFAGLTPTLVRVTLARHLLPLALFAAVVLAFRAPRHVVVAAIALLLIERGAEMSGFIPTVDRAAAHPPIPRLYELAQSATAFRVVGKGSMLTPNVATLFGLEDVRGYQAMTFAPLAATFPQWSTPQPVWFNRVDDLTAPFLSIMNVRYAIVGTTDPTPRGWRDAGPLVAGARLLENTTALPRAFAPSGGTILTRADGGTLNLHASMPRAGWVVVSEPNWRGWRVTSGGKRLHIEPAYGTFVSFYLPQGESDVAMRYLPKGFIAGAIVTLLTAIALLVVSWRFPAPP